jgi:hypothetical protein
VHEKSNLFIEVLNELKLFIDKKVIFDKKKKTFRRSAIRRGLLSAVCQQIL